MAMLMRLPLIVSCSSKIQIVFTFLVLAHLGSLEQRAFKWVFVISIKTFTHAQCTVPSKSNRQSASNKTWNRQNGDSDVHSW